jgi:predicted nucleic acid-binding Zn ribbon protein
LKRAGAELSRLVDDLGLGSSLALARLKSDWATLFSGPLSEHSSPQGLSGGRLLVVVDSQAWMQQLAFFKPQMLLKLRGRGIEELGFKLGRVPKKARPRPPAPRRALTDSERSSVEGLVSGVKDPGLREQIRRAVEKTLGLTNRQAGP